MEYFSKMIQGALICTSRKKLLCEAETFLQFFFYFGNSCLLRNLLVALCLYFGGTEYLLYLLLSCG